MSTGPISALDGKSYKHRIIIPIHWNGELVSFQGRDSTDRHRIKYKACSQDREVVQHQTILYGDESGWDDVGICVEGATDVWRFGKQAFGTFGIEFTKQQIREIAKRFKMVAIVYDDDPQAIKQAYKLIRELEFRDVIAWRIPIVGDPGSMSQEEADEFVQNILK
jgi:DNA primase